MELEIDSPEIGRDRHLRLHTSSYWGVERVHRTRDNLFPQKKERRKREKRASTRLGNRFRIGHSSSTSKGVVDDDPLSIRCAEERIETSQRGKLVEQRRQQLAERPSSLAVAAVVAGTGRKKSVS